LLEALDGVVDVLLALPDDAQMVPGDDVLRVDPDGALEGARRLVEARLVKERDGKPEVRGGRGRVELDRLPRRLGALRHRPTPVVAQGELEVRSGVGVLELEAAFEGARGVAGLAEMVVGQPEVEVRARVVRVGLEGLETAVAHALGEVELQLAAALLAPER